MLEPRVNRVAGRRAAAWLLSCVIALTALAFVSAPAGAKSSSPPVPDGYHLVNLKKTAGLSMAIPDTWLALDPSSKTFQQVIETATAQNPKLAPLVAQFQAISGDSFMAVDQEGTTFVSNLIVSPTALSKSALSQPTQVESALRSELAALKPTDLEVVKTKVGGKPSLRSTATLTVATPDGTPINAYSTSYFVPTKKGVLQLTFSTGGDPDQDETVQSMVDTVKVF